MRPAGSWCTRSPSTPKHALNVCLAAFELPHLLSIPISTNSWCTPSPRTPRPPPARSSGRRPSGECAAVGEDKRRRLQVLQAVMPRGGQRGGPAIPACDASCASRLPSKLHMFVALPSAATGSPARWCSVRRTPRTRPSSRQQPSSRRRWAAPDSVCVAHYLLVGTSAMLLLRPPTCTFLCTLII